MTNLAQKFADQLVELETNGDVDAFVNAVFAADVTLIRPEIGQQHTGPDGARTFWAEYLHQFTTVRSSFDRVHNGEVGVLEWTSEAQLPNGTDISYAGVSLLDFDDDSKVTRFVTYYDTQVFQPGPRAGA